MSVGGELKNELDFICNDVRKNIIELAYRAGANSAHCGGSLSAVEIFVTLYHKFLKMDVNDMANRDRLIISKAHASLAQYCVLASKGVLTREDLLSFEQNGSQYTVHAHKNIEKGFEFSGGSLGLGMSYAVGVAYALKEKGSKARVYVVLGDGECDEGIVWESMMFAKHNALCNLVVIVDHNHLQADGFVEDVMDTANLADKFRSFGFCTYEVDGHSIAELSSAYSKQSDIVPTAIVAETIKGKGVSFMENKYNWHFSVLPEGKYKKAMSELMKYEDGI